MPRLPAACAARPGNATSIGGAGAGARAAMRFDERAWAARLGSSDADAIGEAAHECLAQRELLERHPLVRVMRLRDVTRPADDRRDAGVMEKRRLAAEGNLAEFVRAGARLAQLGDLAAAVRVEAGQRRDVIELDVR